MRGWLAWGLLLLIGCSRPPLPAVEDLSTNRDLSLFKLQSLRGTRDGDRLAAKVMFSDSSSILTLDMNFAVGSPTRLASGAWQWTRDAQVSSGVVSAQSVTFLGGQDGPPSIGGTFQLLNPDGKPLYRVRVPVTELKRQ